MTTLKEALTIDALSPEQQAETGKYDTGKYTLDSIEQAFAGYYSDKAREGFEQLRDALRKAHILDELIELRGTGTRGRWSHNHEESGLISAYGSCDTYDGSIRMSIINCLPTEDKDFEGREFWCDGESHTNAKAITEIMNRLEELK